MELFPTELILPHRTLSGPGRISDLFSTAREFGERGMLVHGHSLVRSGIRDDILRTVPSGMQIECFEHTGHEPTIHDVADLRRAARKNHVQWLAAVGGGSVMDLGKVAAGLFHSDLSVEEHHQGADLDRPGIPFFAAPTTAGTGSEATIVAVLIDPERKLKKSVRHPSYMAQVVILDPELLASCPPRIVAQSGMDAFVQGVESYASRKACWLSDQLSAKSVALISGSLVDVYHKPSSPKADELLTGSYLAGLALSMARLGVIHGLVHPLGVRYDLPHGLLCGMALPAALTLNKSAMNGKYRELSDLAGGDIIAKSRELLQATGLSESPLAGQVIRDREQIIRETLASGSTQANPKTITEDDVDWLLDQLFC